MLNNSYDEQKVQEICGKLVRDNVLACVTWLVDELVELNPDLMHDDERMTNTSRWECPECGEWLNGAEVGYDDDGKEIMGWPSWADETTDDPEWLDDHYQCPNCGHIFHEDEAEEEFAGVSEWFVVSGWLANRLAGHGEVLLDGKIWGRQTTG